MESTLTTTPTVSSHEIGPPAPPIPEPPPGVPYLFNAEQFQRMIDADVFPRESRVELWDGMVYEKMAKNRPHAIAANKFAAALIPATPRGWHVAIEDSVGVGPGRVPLPDIMLVRGAPDDFSDRNPEARDIGLLIELADSSVRFDTGPKLAGYARAGVPHYWVANLPAGVIQAYRDPVPSEGRYASVETWIRSQSIPLVLHDVEVGRIAVDDLLPLHGG